MIHKKAIDIEASFAHNSVPRKAILKTGEGRSNLQTVNDAHLDPRQGFELYYFLEGEGLMTINGKEFEVKSGDSVLVETGESHGLKNVSNIPLRFITVRILI